MNKVILKSSLITLAGLIGAGLLVFSLWILCSPQTMATAAEKTGNYSFAITCADLRYKYTKDTEDLARCAEDAIFLESDSLIIKYGTKLIEDENFANLCEKKNEELSSGILGGGYDYKSFITGTTALSLLKEEGVAQAIAIAEKGGVSAFNKIVIYVVERDKKPEAQEIIKALENFGKDAEPLIEILKKI